MHVLLVHVPQLDALGRVAVRDGVARVARHNQWMGGGGGKEGLINGIDWLAGGLAPGILPLN